MASFLCHSRSSPACPLAEQVSNMVCHLGFLSGSLPLSSKHNTLYLISVNNQLCHNNFWMFAIFSRFWNLPGHKTSNVSVYVRTCAFPPGKDSFPPMFFQSWQPLQRWPHMKSQLLKDFGLWVPVHIWRFIRQGNKGWTLIQHGTTPQAVAAPETPVRVSTAPLPPPLPSFASFPCGRWCWT